MNRTDRFDDYVSDWLHADAEHRVPEHLDAVLRRTSTERQRPAWSSLERWLPMDTASRLQGRLTAPRPILVFALLVALLVAAMGAAVYVGALRSQTPTFGHATNGRILVADGKTVTSYAADGTGAASVLDLPRTAADLVASPDGTGVAMIVQTGPPTMQVVRFGAPGSQTLPVLPGSVDVASAATWSPDSKRVAFLTWDGSRERLVVAPVDGSGITELPLDPLDRSLGLWSPQWSPDGAWIAFVAADRTTEEGNVYLIRPDGTGLQEAGITRIKAGDGVHWSPDPAVQRLLLTRPGNAVAIFDLATRKETRVGSGFWPTWSPDGSRIAYWSDGTVITATDDVLAGRGRQVRPFLAFQDSCAAHPELKDKAFCGPASWSPDGTRVIAADITGTSVVSFLADGTGSPIVIGLTTNVKDLRTPVAWQPIAP